MRQNFETSDFRLQTGHLFNRKYCVPVTCTKFINRNFLNDPLGEKDLENYLLCHGVPVGTQLRQKKSLVCFGDFNNIQADSFDLFDSKIAGHYYVTGNRQYCDQDKVIYRWSLQGLQLALMAETYVVNCYASDINAFLFHNKKLINLWHGIPIKPIETEATLRYYRSEYFFSRFLSPKLCTIDTFIVPNGATEAIFRRAFGSRVREFSLGLTARYRKQRVLVPGALYLSSVAWISQSYAMLEDILGAYEDIEELKPHPKDVGNCRLQKLSSQLAQRESRGACATIFESSLVYHAPPGTRFLLSRNTKPITMPLELVFEAEYRTFNAFRLVERVQLDGPSITRYEDLVRGSE